MIQQLFLGKPFGNNPAPDIVLIIIVVIFGFGFPYAFFKMNRQWMNMYPFASTGLQQNFPGMYSIIP